MTKSHARRIVVAALAATVVACAGRPEVPRGAVSDSDPADCPAWVKEPTPEWAAPYLGKLGIPDPWPAYEGPLAMNCAGIDRWQANHFIGYNQKTAPHLYGDYTPLRVRYEKGALPRCEALVEKYTKGLTSDREKALALLTRAMPGHCLHPTIPPLGGPCAADRNLGDDGLLAAGTAWCNEQARVFVSLCRVAGIPARMIFLFYADRKSGHVIAEFYADGRWSMADSSWGCVFPAADGHLLSAAECHADEAGRALAAEAYRARIREVFRMPDETLAGKDVPGGPSDPKRREALAARVKSLREQFDTPAYCSQLWAFGVLNHPAPGKR
jgi:hypothetical protein